MRLLLSLSSCLTRRPLSVLLQSPLGCQSFAHFFFSSVLRSIAAFVFRNNIRRSLIIQPTDVSVNVIKSHEIAGIVSPSNCQSCGRQLEGLEGELTHQEYPDDYSADANCQWTTIAREKDKVFIDFERLDVEADRDGGCTYDYVRYGMITSTKFIIMYS